MCHPEFFLFSKASPGSKKWRKTSEQKRNRQTTHLFPKGSDRINISVIQPWWILQTLALCLYMILLFSPYLHFSFQCSFLCPQSQLHIHSSGVSVAWRPVSGMAKHWVCPGYPDPPNDIIIVTAQAYWGLSGFVFAVVVHEDCHLI